MKKTLLPGLVCMALFANAQIKITSSKTTYSQDFNGLSNNGSSNSWINNATIQGWYSNRGQYLADNGSSSTIGMYSYGTVVNERALGQIVGNGNENKVYYGVRFKNTTGGPINSIYVGYTGEQWRAVNSSAATLKFQYQVTTAFSSITSGNFTDFEELDFVSVKNNISARALDGNNNMNRAVKAGVIKLVTPLENNQEIILRWAIPNNSSQHGLAIDDLTVNFAVNNTLHIPGGISIQNLVVDGFDVTFDGSLNIKKALTLKQGIIHTAATDLLTLTDDATVTGANNESFVDGPVRKVGNDTFVFPVGKNGKYVPIAISAPNDVNSAFVAEYFPSGAASWGPITSPDLVNVSSCEYWDLDRTSGSSPVNVTLFWDEDNACSGPGYIKDATTITVAHFDGSSWNSHGGIGVGSTASGSVTWRNVNQFSPITLGSTSENNVLPVRFAGIKASEKSSGVQIDFTNLTESDVDYYEIERSSDGRTFVGIKRLMPVKNDFSSASYNYLDALAANGRYIYRIKAVETTGKIIYSSMVSIISGSRERTLNIYARNSQVNMLANNLPAGKYQLRVFSAVGQLISAETLNHSGGSVSQTMQLNGERSGVYIFTLDGPINMHKKFMIQ